MTCIIKRILTITEPVVFGKIQLWDDNHQDITTTSLYSWSSDSVCWTNWADYNTYIQVASNIEGDYYLRILLFGGFKEIAINDGLINCYSICLFNENMFMQDLCSDAVFNPYANLDCALYLQQQLSDSVICMLGIPCYYFKVAPNVDSADYTFKEYVLHNVTDVKMIKLMIPDGTMPSSKPQMSEFDFDWEVDWEVECSKNAFAKAFGDTAFPKHNDFVYIPMMKRMWNVNSAYDEKNEGLMWHSTTWKLGLVKYNEHLNIDQGVFEDVIDTFLVNTYENTFEYAEDEEQRRDSGIDQITSPNYSANNVTNIFITDYVRNSVSNEEIKNVEADQVNHGSLVLSRNCYVFQNEQSVIEYNKKWCYDSGTVEMLIKREDDKECDKVLLSLGDVQLKLQGNKIVWGDSSFDLIKDDVYVVIMKWSKDNFSCNISIYKQNKPVGVPAYKLRPEMFKFDFEQPVYDHTFTYNNDYNNLNAHPVVLSPNPLKVYYMKVFDRYLDNKESIKECCKYTTTNEHCLINDLARPFEDNYGYSVQ